jgi:hypothetical protein
VTNRLLRDRYLLVINKLVELNVEIQAIGGRRMFCQPRDREAARGVPHERKDGAYERRDKPPLAFAGRTRDSERREPGRSDDGRY